MISLLSLIITLPWIIIGLTVHEFAHAYVAYLCGDKLAKSQGRLTLNPLKHIDPLGFIFIMIAGFGWAKPVMINEWALRNPRRDELLVALAGPFSNVILAVVFSFLYVLLPQDIADGIIGYFFLGTIYINWGLFFFNILPIPPLDGSHIFFSDLKNKNPLLYIQIYRYGTAGLFLLLIFSSSSGINLLPIWTATEYWGNLCIDFFVKIFG